MENYHIYNEIGKGKYSVVYRGRQKKTIAYVAIKSVSKGRISKILNEVQILHKLSSPTVINFYNWYESKNHIWLIFEYCTGGDLLKLIIQDMKLPESVIMRFGYNIMQGLQYLHSQGFIYCDLKPANVIIDENGIMKLSDFGLCRSIPTQQTLHLKELKRGTPQYMSPELFEEDGIHSFASDFWALGCLLYELRRGNPPFNLSNFHKLVHQILIIEVAISIEDQDISPVFRDLLRRLLTKDPSNRITWNELRNHQFWKDLPLLPDVNLPEQPMYEIFIKRAAEVGACKEDGQISHEDSKQARSVLADEFKEDEPQNGDSSRKSLQEEQLDVNQQSSILQRPFNLEAKERPASAPVFQEVKDDNFIIDVEIRKEEYTNIRQITLKTVPSKISQKQNSSTLWSRCSPTTLMDDLNLIFSGSKNVTHIIRDQEIELIPAPMYKEEFINFQVVECSELLAMQHSNLEEYLNQVNKSLVTSTTTEQKFNLLGYVYTLCLSPKIANIIVNTDLMSVLLTFLHDESDEIKSCVVLTIGLILRFAINIQQAMTVHNIANALTPLLRDSNDCLRRRAAASLGELIFYYSMQPTYLTQEVEKRKAKENNDAFVQSFTISSTLLCLEDKDEIIRYYAAKSIENLLNLSKKKEFIQRFITLQVAFLLVDIAEETNIESLRATCLNAVIHLIRLSISTYGTFLLIQVISKQSLIKMILRCLSLDVQSTLLKSCLRILSICLCQLGETPLPNNVKRVKEDIFKEETTSFLISTLLQTIELPSEDSVYPTAMTTLYFLLKLKHELVIQCCERNLTGILEKIMVKQTRLFRRNNFLISCVSAMVSFLGDLAIKVMDLAVKKATVTEDGESWVDFLPIPLHVINSNFLWRKMQISNRGEQSLKTNQSQQENKADILFDHFCTLLNALPSILNVKCQNVCLPIAESIVDKSKSLMKASPIFIKRFVPALSSVLLSTNGDYRVCALTMLRTILQLCLSSKNSEEKDENHSEENDLSSSNYFALNYQQLDICIVQEIFPRIQALLIDIDPIPAITLSLLLLIVQHNSKFVGLLHQLKLIHRIIYLLELQPLLGNTTQMVSQQHENNISPTVLHISCVKLVLAIVESQEITVLDLINCGIHSGITKALKYAEHHKMFLCLHHLLHILYTILFYVSCNLQEINATSMSNEVNKSFQSEALQVLLHSHFLIKNTKILLRLCATVEDTETLQENSFPSIAATSSQCVLLMGQLFNNRFFDVLYSIQALNPSTPRKTNLLYILYALDSNNIQIQSRLLKTIRYSLKGTNANTYGMEIMNNRGLWGKLKRLSCFSTIEEDGIQSNEKNDVTSISRLAHAICTLARDIPSRELLS